MEVAIIFSESFGSDSFRECMSGRIVNGQSFVFWC